MKITHSNGRTIKAALLSQDENLLRVTAQGADDAMAIRIGKDGSLVAESGERVTVEFEWQRVLSPSTPALEDCICSKELASHLLSSLFNPERDELGEQLLGLSAGVQPCVLTAHHAYAH